MAENWKKGELEDDAKEKVSLMVKHRLPWLLVGLFGGIAATIFTSRFETLLAENIRLSFFIPVIVYMADALGTQTESVYVRNLGRVKVNFSLYLIKELLLGIVLGLLCGGGIGIFAYAWFQSIETAVAVSTAMFLSMTIAPVIALIVPTVLQKVHKDPAVGAGPFGTVIQDVLSLMIYFLIAGYIILK